MRAGCGWAAARAGAARAPREDRAERRASWRRRADMLDPTETRAEAVGADMADVRQGPTKRRGSPEVCHAAAGPRRRCQIKAGPKPRATPRTVRSIGVLEWREKPRSRVAIARASSRLEGACGAEARAPQVGETMSRPGNQRDKKVQVTRLSKKRGWCPTDRDPQPAEIRPLIDVPLACVFDEAESLFGFGGSWPEPTVRARAERKSRAPAVVSAWHRPCEPAMAAAAGPSQSVDPEDVTIGYRTIKLACKSERVTVQWDGTYADLTRIFTQGALSRLDRRDSPFRALMMRPRRSSPR